jgi:hypothetical protein
LHNGKAFGELPTAASVDNITLTKFKQFLDNKNPIFDKFNKKTTVSERHIWIANFMYLTDGKNTTNKKDMKMPTENEIFDYIHKLSTPNMVKSIKVCREKINTYFGKNLLGHDEIKHNVNEHVIFGMYLHIFTKTKDNVKLNKNNYDTYRKLCLKTIQFFEKNKQNVENLMEIANQMESFGKRTINDVAQISRNNESSEKEIQPESKKPLFTKKSSLNGTHNSKTNNKSDNTICAHNLIHSQSAQHYRIDDESADAESYWDRLRLIFLFIKN